MLQILVVDDDEQMQFFLKEALLRQGYGVTVQSTAEDALDCLRSGRFDLVLLDVRLPGMSGLVAVERVLRLDPHMPIIVMTAHGSGDGAIEAIRRGAYDYFAKPFRLEEMEIVIRRALERRRLLAEIERLRLELADGARGRMIGTSRAMSAVFRLIERVAPTDSTVLILGESGTGKELIAENIHRQSPRRDRPFIKLNCAAIPEALLESELFGHEKGAFTGALMRKTGKFELADGGTLLLDEIGDMDLAVQAQFLKVIEDKTYRRLGEVRERKSNFRMICATNRDLASEAEQGRFRKDLLYRVQVLPLHIPTLQDRREDIPGLVRHLLAFLNYQYRDISPEVVSLLESCAWPGNVRELRNVLERALLLARGAALEARHFPGLQGAVDAPRASQAGMKELERIEMESIRSALLRFDGDVNKTAEALGISRATIFRRLKKYSQPSV